VNMRLVKASWTAILAAASALLFTATRRFSIVRKFQRFQLKRRRQKKFTTKRWRGGK
jgi:hypothetical protein